MWLQPLCVLVYDTLEGQPRPLTLVTEASRALDYLLRDYTTVRHQNCDNDLSHFKGHDSSPPAPLSLPCACELCNGSPCSLYPSSRCCSVAPQGAVSFEYQTEQSSQLCHIYTHNCGPFMNPVHHSDPIYAIQGGYSAKFQSKTLNKRFMQSSPKPCSTHSCRT